MAAAMLMLFSCNDPSEKTGPHIEGRDSLPTLRTLGVSTLVSDSGVIRYKIIAEEWFIYDKKDPQYWAFPKGLFIETFNRTFQAEAFISCDTAYHFYSHSLWELRGRVLAKNIKGETFKTTLLYWDTRAHRLYSPAYMEIDGETQKLSGYDFSSNEQMTEYIIHSSKGEFPLEDNSPTPEPDPAMMADSTRNQP